MQVKPMKFHYISVKIAKIHNTDNTKCSDRNFYSLLVEIQNDTAAFESSLAVTYKTKHTLGV